MPYIFIVKTKKTTVTVTFKLNMISYVQFIFFFVNSHLFVNNYEIYFVKLFQCMTVHGLSSIICLLLINLFKTIHL